MNKIISKQLQMVSRQIKRSIDKIFQSAGLSGAQAFTLHFIHEKSKNGKVYAKDIEIEFNTRRATIAELIHTMEQNNLVERESEETDSRMKEIILTKKALEKVQFIDSKIKQLEQQISNNIESEELSNFFEVLNKISENLL